MRYLSSFLGIFFFFSVLGAEWNQKVVIYEIDGAKYESTIVWEDSVEEPVPGILMVPNWMGPTESSLDKARKVAEEGFVVMMVDMYGVNVRPTNASEASQAAGKLRADREIMRKVSHHALKQFKLSAGEHEIPMDSERMAGIGFCFGGGTVLELARSGVEIDAVVSFHGDVKSPTLVGDATQIKAAVLVLHGAKDPYVPQDHIQEFVEVMNATEVDWQLVQLAGAVHSFTNPLANSKGAKYDERASERAFEYMDELFESIWEED